nr:PepSY-associated TM helix domain-containing protein [Sinimarinibacterium sp. NLF-5-8]
MSESVANMPPRVTVKRRSSARALWTKQLHLWHWITAAISMVGMLGFAITGITLNHAGQISATPQRVSQTAEVPETELAELRARAQQVVQDGMDAPLPPRTRSWLRAQWNLKTGARAAEWSADEVYLSLPQPGGDAWLAVQLADGHIEYERTTRGWVSYFNDLHKGRNTGVAWSWFIDVFAVVCVLFTLTGLLLLKLHAAKRASTWPLVAAGLVIPLFLLLFLMH